MKADLTRRTFRHEQHYIATLQQQGRVPLDADWNEQADIQQHHDETALTDVIGPAGVPKGDSFKLELTPGATDLHVFPGRAYVDGILCESDADGVRCAITATNIVTPVTTRLDGIELRVGEWITVASSPTDGKIYQITGIDLTTLQVKVDPHGDNLVTLFGGAAKQPTIARAVSYYFQPEWAEPTKPVAGLYLAYLDVWKRHVTALEDPAIREVALGGPDTCTRVRTTWQVRLGPMGNATTCETATLPVAPARGALAARALQPGDTSNPCAIPATARYRSLENQLYRVEVHDAGPLGTATFKFSADNGSFVTAWTGGSGIQLLVGSTGKDSVMRFSAGDWVEVLDDSTELAGAPGAMYKIASVEPGKLTLDGALGPDITKYPTNPRVRKWDQKAATLLVERPVPNEGFLALDGSGVEIRFEPGYYTTGDYWLIPARTITADVEWPQSDTGEPLALPRQGIEHHYAKLGLVGWDGSKFEIVDDCRKPFPPLTDIHAKDVIMDPGPCDFPDNVKTVYDAISELCQQKENACCELVIVPGDDVQSAIDIALAKNVARGIKGLHVCFAAGTHTLTKMLVVKAPAGGGDITLSGCGLASHVSAPTLGTAIQISGWTTAVVADLSIVSGVPATIVGGLQQAPIGLPIPNAAVVMLDCLSSCVEGASITCGNGSRRVTSCIAIQTSQTPSKSDARVVNCDLTVGNTQGGITIVNAARSTVEGNRIDPGTISANGLVAYQMSPEYLGMLKKRMLSELSIGAAASTTVATREGKARNHVTIDHVKLAFTSDSELESAWSSFFAAGGFAKLGRLQRAQTLITAVEQSRRRTPATTVPTPPPANVPPRTAPNANVPAAAATTPVTELDARAQIAADRVPNYLASRVASALDAAVTKMLKLVADPKTTKDQIAAAHLAPFLAWKALQDTQVAAVMAYAVVVSGSQADDVRILENSITGAANGIRVALTPPPGLIITTTVYSATRVQITGNTITLTAPLNAPGQHSGVFVASCHSLAVTNNLTQHLQNKAKSTAIRIAGVLGRSIRVEGNHAVTATTGIHIAAVAPPVTEPGPQPPLNLNALWILSQNVAENATTPIVVTPANTCTLIHNVP